MGPLAFMMAIGGFISLLSFLESWIKIKFENYKLKFENSS
jgi:hypothetical protein